MKQVSRWNWSHDLHASILAWTLILCPDLLSAAATAVWERNLINGYNLGEFSRPPFAAGQIRGNGQHVEGTFGYVTVQAATVTLKGVRTPDGRFWPDVAFQVSNDRVHWIRVRQIARKATPDSQTVGLAGTVEKPAVSLLYVTLDAFRPFVGKSHYGRVILKNGVAAEFDLLWLLPPKNLPGARQQPPDPTPDSPTRREDQES